MATVEDIYQKIRRGDTAGLSFARPSEEDLSAGVERIRARLANSGKQKNPRLLRFPAWAWVPAAAAICVVGLLLVLKQPARPEGVVYNPGAEFQFGSVVIHTLRPAVFEHSYTGTHLQLALKSGMLAIKRRDPATQLTVSTPDGRLSATGTTFVIEYDRSTSVHLLEGKLIWHGKNKSQEIIPGATQLGRDLKQEIIALPAAFNPPKKNSGKEIISAFQKGDCVMYTLNGNRREGKIQGVLNGQYRVVHDGIVEPDAFGDSDLIRCARGKP